jgi:hypothetical protein
LNFFIQERFGLPVDPAIIGHQDDLQPGVRRGAEPRLGESSTAKQRSGAAPSFLQRGVNVGAGCRLTTISPVTSAAEVRSSPESLNGARRSAFRWTCEAGRNAGALKPGENFKAAWVSAASPPRDERLKSALIFLMNDDLN